MKLIKSYAKVAAREGLELRDRLPESQKFGIDKEEAKSLGIASGVERAKQLIANKYLPHEDVIRTARFYARFKNRYTPRVEGAMLIWGGRRWCRECYYEIYGEG